MVFKTGAGWKACYDEATGRYTAERSGAGYYHLYEITEELFASLEDGMSDEEVYKIIGQGRHLYMAVDDRTGPPYTVVLDDDYEKICPWAKVMKAGRTWPDELTDAAVEIFASEENNREQRRIKRGEREKTALKYLTLRERPELKESAAAWFHSKWNVPLEAYLECMDAYLGGETEYGWYLCMDGDRIVGGMGVIENDFHDRKDLFPNVCAVYTEEAYRDRGIAGKLLDMVVEDTRSKGITPIYLVTDHEGFYERYGWEFFCMVRCDGETEMSRMYIHR